MDFLFVHWFQRDSNFNAGWDAKRPHCLQFFGKDHTADVFGFVDPDSVIRGVHLIPAFALGSTDEYLGPSFIRQDPETAGWHLDWRYFYINMFVDRDMFMHFRGGGIGHKITRDWDEFLLKHAGA
ncbi:hypothetical protein PAXINDRAFT_72847 [Paxillus involutus ATCC 200175]|nr:hypothetical protein PAXINDRAFT_72847 [Paxillus involutus ATCC 200175]